MNQEFRSINGFRVRVVDTIEDEAAIHFSTAGMGFTTPTTNEFNQWLKKRFGYKPVYYFMDNTIITNRRGFDLLKIGTRKARIWQY